MGNTFAMLMLTAAVLMAAGYLFYRPVLYAFGASDITFPYASVYIRIYLAGTFFVMISLGMNPFINSQGFARTGMLTVLIGAVLNIFLDPLLIFGLHMGVSGAAVATIFSQFCSALWVLKFLTGKRSELHLRRSSMKLSAVRVRSIISLGVSGFVMAFTNSLVQVVCNTTLHTWGGDIYVGVMTVLNSIREIFSMPIMGLVNGSTPVMSFNYGAGSFDRVKKAIRFITLAGFVFTTSVWLLLRVAPEPFIRIFNSDPLMIEKGIPALHIYFFGFCFMVFQFSGQATFVALGKAKRATFFSLLRKAFIVVPLTILLPHIGNLGVDGVFWAEPISNVVGGCACFFTMLKTVMPELSEKKTV